jgi:hypothetical protein
VSNILPEIHPTLTIFEIVWDRVGKRVDTYPICMLFAFNTPHTCAALQASNKHMNANNIPQAA